MWNYGSMENQGLYNALIEKQYTGVPTAEQMVRVAKDAPMLSTTTGFLNTNFGAQVFQELEELSVLFGLLPKFDYALGGYRAKTAKGTSSGIGVAENANIPATTKPTIAEVPVPIKEHSTAREISERQRMLMERGDDTAWEDVSMIMEDGKSEFVNSFDKDLNQDVTTLAANNVESIDRVCSSYSEVTNCADVNAGDSDIYGLDRDAQATWADAYVSHNSGTDRSLTEAILTNLINGTTKNGAQARTQVWYMGSDTYKSITDLDQTKVRYFTEAQNASDTGLAAGPNFGLQPGKLFARPVFVAPEDQVTTNGTLSNLYLFDLGLDKVRKKPILGIKVLRAPIIAQTGLANNQYPAHGKLGNEMVIYSAMELECRNFKRQGKARDLA